MSLKTKALCAAFAAAALFVAGDYVYTNAYNYSSGSRTGSVFKLSDKGMWPCRTWEGQANMDGFGPVDGQRSNVTSSFEFTVTDKSLLPKFKEAERTHERVEIEYRQAKWTLSCIQKSEYVATGINKVDGQGNATPFIVAIPAQAPKR